MNTGRATAAILTLSSAVLLAQAQQPVSRRPLTKDYPELRSPATYRIWTRMDPETGREVEVDPKPTITLLDARTGRYALRWIGLDGRTRTIRYQRDDRIDVVASADALRKDPATFRYLYRVAVLSSSVQHLRRFVVQSFASDAKQLAQPRLLTGAMTSHPAPFREGQWWDFALRQGFRPNPAPGSVVAFELESSSAPGLVGCRVAGAREDMVGVGEEPPPELMDALPGYDAWPHGNTIGPDERLRSLSPAQRAAKLVEWLPEFQRQGWMTPERRRHYEAAAQRGDLRGLASIVDADLRAERITTEVRAIVLGLADLLGK